MYKIHKLLLNCIASKNLGARFLSRQTSACQLVDISENSSQSVSLLFTDALQLKFHHVWLRDHCRCPECYNETTGERVLLPNKLSFDMNPEKVFLDNGSLKITWKDGHLSKYDSDWLLENKYGQPFESSLINGLKREFWTNDLSIEPINFERLHEETQLLNLLEKIAVYGLAMVSNTPTTLESLRSVADAVGGPRKCHYGDVWVVDGSKLEHADLAYSNCPLPVHNDGTYFMNGPGLQMFHCHQHNGEGGETILVDGISAVEQLRKENPEAFNYLSNTPIPAKYYEPGHCSRNLDSLIKVDPHSKEVYQVRVNNGDRDVLSCLPFVDVERFYASYLSFANILYAKERELRFKLTPGNLLIVDNWRVLHGRTSFNGLRSLAGCYINKDDALSVVRVLREKVKGVAA